MTTYQEVRIRWEQDKPVYKEFGAKLKRDLSLALKNEGISSKISYRIKDTDSLFKKLIRKNVDYDKIHDKVGVRIVVDFKNQLKAIDELIVNLLDDGVKKREDMSEKLGESAFGYQAIHYDICYLKDDKEYYCELQLRTICQNTWSELSHALAYKAEINIPLNIRREINALSAVFELADNQFQIIRTLIDGLPDTNPIKILNYLENFFYSHIGDSYDPELSGYFLSNIAKLYGNSNPIQKLQNFLQENAKDLIELIEENRDNFFFTQPEIVLILERLTNRKHDLVEYWDALYPKEELELIANSWGESLE